MGRSREICQDFEFIHMIFFGTFRLFNGDELLFPLLKSIRF